MHSWKLSASVDEDDNDDDNNSSDFSIIKKFFLPFDFFFEFLIRILFCIILILKFLNRKL